MADQKMPERRHIHRTPVYTIIVYFYWLIAKIFFFMRFEGLERVPHGVPCILMGNHQCMLDPVTLALCARDRELRFMGKKELFEIPFLGKIFRMAHGFPVDRGNMDMSAIRTSIGVLAEGESLGIFPEGTRSHTGHMLPLLGGASMIALRGKCPVVPVYIDGNYRIFRPIVVRIGEPIKMDDLLAGRVNRESCEELTRRMETSFFKLSGGRSLPPASETMENKLEEK